MQQVTNLERQDNSIEDIFCKFDDEVCRRLKEEKGGYDGEKQNPKDWLDIYESDLDFKDEFDRIFSDGTIP